MIFLNECLAVLAGICLNGPATVTLVDNWSWRGAEIKSHNSIIRITDRSDTVLHVDRSRMNKFCSKVACVYYHKYCSTMTIKVDYTITYVQSDKEEGRQVFISSSGRAEVEDSLKEFRIFPTMIALSSLNAESPTIAPPRCPRLRRGSSSSFKC